MTWPLESFALADGFDAATGRYLALRAGRNIEVHPDSSAVLVKPDLASRQMESESPAGTTSAPSTQGSEQDGGASTNSDSAPVPAIRRFFGTVTLDPTRVGRDASRIAEEVIAHLVGQPGADVSVRLEIAADLPDGASDQVVRTVSENSRTLKFDTHGFERE
jgi:hypothetical protein